MIIYFNIDVVLIVVHFWHGLYAISSLLVLCFNCIVNVYTVKNIVSIHVLFLLHCDDLNIVQAFFSCKTMHCSLIAVLAAIEYRNYKKYNLIVNCS